MIDKCGACGNIGFIHKHHKKRVSQGRDDSDNNIAKLCPRCHTILHSSPPQFKKLFSEDLYYKLLPSLQSKREYKKKLEAIG